MVAISQSHAGLFRRLAVALVDNHPRINQARITAATPWVGTRTLSPQETRMPAADSPSIPYFALVALQYPCSPTILRCLDRREIPAREPRHPQNASRSDPSSGSLYPRGSPTGIFSRAHHLPVE